MYQCTTNYLYYLPLSNKFNNIQLMNMFHGWKYWCLIVYYPKTSLSPWNTHCVGYRLKTWHLWLLEKYGMEDREDREVIINPPIYPKQEVAGVYVFLNRLFVRLSGPKYVSPIFWNRDLSLTAIISSILLGI